MNLMIPIYGSELADIRAQHKRPAGRIVITGDEKIATIVRNHGKCALLVPRYARYDFSMIYELPVIFSLPDIPNAFRIAAQIAACHPSHFALQYPGEPEEVTIWN